MAIDRVIPMRAGIRSYLTDLSSKIGSYPHAGGDKKLTNVLVVLIIVVGCLFRMFIRADKQGKRTYYYLVEAIREGSKVRQKRIKYLGKVKPSPGELEAIIKGLQAEQVRIKRKARK